MLKITLKACRTNVGLSRKEAGVKIGVSPDTIYKWEKGESFPSSKYIPAIVKTYGVPYDNILFLPTNHA